MSLTLRIAPSSMRPHVLRLLAAQLAEHSIDIGNDELGAAIDGVFENPSRGIFHVAILGEEIVGVSYVSYIWALEHGGPAAWLEELYVEPRHRGHSIGQKLLDETLSYVRAQGCHAIDLEVESDHQRVESLYRRNGFERRTRSRWFREF